MKDCSALHTFVICAYKDNPFLEDCIRSLTAQSVRSSIILYSSTPTDKQRELAGKYNIRYHVDTDGHGIHHDWNKALALPETPYCTLAHQDDVYLPDYAEKMVDALRRHPDALIGFTDYADLFTDGTVKFWRAYLLVKRLMLAPFYLKRCIRSGFVRLNVLRFGNPICCPSVTYHLAKLGGLGFDAGFSVNLDWMMWINLAKRPGGFLFLKNCLMYHRISAAMETSAALADNRRQDEDAKIFRMMFPASVAGLIHKLYALSYKSNRG
jgi:glycosyltransferase involved in cell wall biosynthesis